MDNFSEDKAVAAEDTHEKSSSFQEYIFGAEDVDDRERLIVQHELFKSAFLENFTKVLDEYGLAARLEQAKATGQKVRILDMGCGEGLYLNTVEDVLNELGFIDAIQLIGVDKDVRAIEFANEMATAKPYLEFVVHELTEPFASSGKPALAEPFDFIYEVATGPYIPNFKAFLKTKFETNLKPGGAMYLRDFTTNEQDTEWINFNPKLTPFFRAFMEVVTTPNKGVDVGRDAQSFLAEIETAENIQASVNVVPIDGKSELGMNMLRNTVLLVRNTGPMLVRMGKITQADFERTWEITLNEIDETIDIATRLVNTIARKKEL
jgi:SAM-dependent methyltransferase